jgi:hypothetical protein
VTGDLTVRVELDNFAKYALFTNAQQMPNGTNVWFTGNTRFVGPVHTNDRFNIYGNPSGVFDGRVSQFQEDARFYNNGWNVLINDDHNGEIDVPTFNAGFDRDVDVVTLDSAVARQDMIHQASGNTDYDDPGVYLPNVENFLNGGVFVKGNATVFLDTDGNNNARYTISQGGDSYQVIVDRVNNQTMLHDGVDQQVFSGIPDGVDGVGTIIYVDGSIQSLGGVVKSDTKLTIASTDDVVIQDHLVYEDYTPPVGTPGQEGYVPPHANGKTNLLGLVTWNGDVVIGNSAPDNVSIHATILAQNDDGDAILRVANHDDTGVGERGTATLLGGVITQRYGAFGLFDAGTGQNISGYGRNFVYDERMRMGSAPPYFPSLDTFILYSDDITDRLVWN